MNGKQLITALMTISLPFGFGITASAKTHNLKISVNKLTDRSTYISGKTSAKAKVSVTRNGIVYAKGKANSKGLFKLKASNPLSSDWHYRVTAAKKGYKTISKYVLVSSKSSKQGSKSTQDQIKALNKKIADLQKQISGLNQNPQTVYVNNSTSNGDSGTEDGSDSYDKNKDYWSGTSQNMYVVDESDESSVMLYTDGNSGSDSVDRVFGMTDNIHTIKTWVNNSVEGLYPVEYNGQKLFVNSDYVTNIDADNSSNQLYYKEGIYYANYSPEKSNVRTFNGLQWNQYTPTGIHSWVFRDGSWYD
ncbi:hypothetical protein LG101_12000 [Levilactobacillus brevis]|nr:hypothetical protein LG101_13515 [Levilactobacillus brevis]OOV21515.1 hypothetical protein LG101_12000 [Levilactobacillus brevis]